MHEISGHNSGKTLEVFRIEISLFLHFQKFRFPCSAKLLMSISELNGILVSERYLRK